MLPEELDQIEAAHPSDELVMRLVREYRQAITRRPTFSVDHRCCGGGIETTHGVLRWGQFSEASNIETSANPFSLEHLRSLASETPGNA